MPALDIDELNAALATIAGSPPDEGRLEMVVRRPAEDEREVVTEARIEPGLGLVGDSRMSRAKVSPEAEVTLMNARCIALLAGTSDRWPLAGDQLYVDLDLSERNLPAGSYLRVGEAVLEVSAKPHRGCAKFAARFGDEALLFVNSDHGRASRLRGLNARVVQAGTVRVGDAVAKVSQERDVSDSYPRQAARTRSFNLGLPRAFRIADDGARVAFLRSRAGDDPVAGLWVLDVDEGIEREVFHPASGQERLTQEEIDRRERAGEKQSGVTAFTADADLRAAVFVSGDALMSVDLTTGASRTLETAGRPFDPRFDPLGRRIAYETAGSLRVLDVASGEDVMLAGDEGPDVRWGVAEFIAAEEMDRSRGHWWSPGGERLIACRVDDGPVGVRHIASPIDPEAPPRVVRYPQAGASNSIVTLHVLGVDGTRADVAWDRDAFEYVVAVSWTDEGPPLALVQSRDQRDVQVLAIDPDSGATEVVHADHDDVWTHITPGVPAWLPGGRLLTVGHRDDTRTLLIDGEPVSPAGMQLDSVLDAGDAVWFSATREPTELHVWRSAGVGDPVQVSQGEGQHSAVIGGDLAVMVSETVDEPLPTARLVRGDEELHVFDRVAETPVLVGRPTYFSAGARELRTAVFTPHGREPSEPLPVLLDPYGGPHWGRVVRAQRPLLESQWLADQGFVVLVIDGRGTPYRGVAWEQAVHRSYLDLALEDQVDGLHAAAERFGFLDLSRVAIRGWSYGGYLTLGALLRRPDVFHAGISGAPVTDMRLYDTHYTERYLGMPDTDTEAYENADLIPDAPKLRGELLLIHGLADDNVYAAHSLRMSKALMEAGRAHSFIPLSGITHRPTDPAAAEAMLRIEVDFLHRALERSPGTDDVRQG